MFHFPAFPPLALCVQTRVTAHDDCRVSPFGHPRITARLTTPRGLSRPPTSFIGSWCQGIHRAPLKTWPQMLASTVQFSNNNQPPTTPNTNSPSTPGPATKRPDTTTPKQVDGARTLRHPTARPTPHQQRLVFHTCTTQAVLAASGPEPDRVVNVPPMSNQHQTFADELASGLPRQPRSAP